MGMLTAFRWYGRDNREPPATPPRELQMDMLAEIDAGLRSSGQQPHEIACLSWRRPANIEPGVRNAAIGMVMVRTKPGRLNTPLRTWFAWQHVSWAWSMEPLPELPVQGFAAE